MTPLKEILLVKECYSKIINTQQMVKIMKSELINVSGRGVCILISGITNDFLKSGKLPSINLIFSDIHRIADAIRCGHKIAAIKEIRSQTGWGLRKSKDYIDKYCASDFYAENESIHSDCADKFIAENSPELEFLEEDEMKI